jgi:diketogulonate reductase-like aldo/keto reductase
LETLLGKGEVRAIGVSDFKTEYVHTLLERVEVLPAVNQTMVHYFTQQATGEFDGAHGILTQAWSPIAMQSCSQGGKRAAR